MDQQPVAPSGYHSGQPAPAIAYASPALHQETFRPTEGIAKFIIVLFYVLIGLQLVSIGSTYMQVQLLQGAAVGDMTDEAADANDMRQLAIGVVILVAVITLAISYIIWLRRSYRNQTALGAQGLKYSPGWATAYWFIPILNLFRPYQVTKELYQTSDPASDGSNWSYLPTAPLLGWWWAAWVISGIADRVSSRMVGGEPTIEQLLRSSWADIVTSVLAIIAAVLALMVVRVITERQNDKFASQRLEGAAI